MRVVIADDSLLAREGIAAVLRMGGADVIAEENDGPAALRSVALLRPDAVILDMRMAPGYVDEGLVTAATVRARYPAVGAVVLSAYLNPAYALRLLDAAPGGVGYLLKDRVADPGVLLSALERTHAGECVIDPGIVAQLVDRPRAPSERLGLTPREHQVLTLMAEGLSNRAIGERLHVSDRTVESHAGAIFDKFGLLEQTGNHRRVLAVLTYLRSK